MSHLQAAFTPPGSFTPFNRWLCQMKIFVLTACAQNPEEKLFLNDERNAFAPDDQTRIINDFDQIGVEAAVRLMEAGAADDVTVFHLGDAMPLLYKALAIGASRAVICHAIDSQISSGSVVDAALRACDDPQNTLFICGKLNVNFESAQTAQRLAQALHCPCISCAKSITPLQDGSLDIACEDDQGSPHYKASTPLVVTTDLRLAEVRFPSLPSIIKAKRKPVLAPEFRHSDKYDWELETDTMIEMTKSHHKCRFISMDDAVKLIQDAKSDLSAPTKTDACPELPKLRELYHNSPLSILYVGAPESVSDARLDQFAAFAEFARTDPVIVTSNVCQNELLNAAKARHIKLAKIESHTPFAAAKAAESLAQALENLPIHSILAAHTPRNIQVLAELASAAQIAFCPNLASDHARPARLISAGTFIELLKPFKTPFCATLSDTGPLRLDAHARPLHFNAFHPACMTAFEPLTSEGTPEGARLIFSVGRGAASLLDDIRPLAKHYGAALGASRVVVDMGLIDNAHQVGLTGHIVSPDLYVALGISGAIQHQAGLRNAPQILAINNDKNAPIFEFAHYGVLADVNELIKKL